MLAILYIKMQWTKENRTPAGSQRRQEYYKPIMIEPDVALSGEGIFVKKCNYLQQGEEILYDVEISEKLEKQLYEENIGTAFTGRKEHEQKMAQYRNNRIRRDKGAFLSADKLAIPCIEIVEEAEQCYRIKWYECYYVYVVNARKLSPDIFIRDYTYTYNQLADLF